MLEKLLGLRPLFRVLMKHHLEDVDERLSVVLEHRVLVVNFPLQNEFLDFGRVEVLRACDVSFDGIKGRLSRQQNVENNSCRPNVNFVVVVLENHFGCQIVNASSFAAKRTRLVYNFRQPQVDNFDFVRVLVLHQNVLRLQVAMDFRLKPTDVVVVHVRQGTQQLDHDVSHELQRD